MAKESQPHALDVFNYGNDVARHHCAGSAEPSQG